MSDPLSLGLASTAVGLVNGTISLLKDAKQAAKSSQDHELKEKVSEVYDEILNLKEAVSNLAKENEDLRRQLTERAKVKWDGKIGAYFAEGDPDPFCPACFDGNSKLVRLTPVFARSGSSEVWKYDCGVCNYGRILPD